MASKGCRKVPWKTAWSLAPRWSIGDVIFRGNPPGDNRELCGQRVCSQDPELSVEPIAAAPPFGGGEAESHIVNETQKPPRALGTSLSMTDGPNESASFADGDVFRLLKDTHVQQGPIRSLEELGVNLGKLPQSLGRSATNETVLVDHGRLSP